MDVLAWMQSYSINYNVRPNRIKIPASTFESVSGNFVMSGSTSGWTWFHPTWPGQHGGPFVCLSVYPHLPLGTSKMTSSYKPKKRLPTFCIIVLYQVGFVSRALTLTTYLSFLLRMFKRLNYVDFEFPNHIWVFELI